MHHKLKLIYIINERVPLGIQLGLFFSFLFFFFFFFLGRNGIIYQINPVFKAFPIIALNILQDMSMLRYKLCQLIDHDYLFRIRSMSIYGPKDLIR